MNRGSLIPSSAEVELIGLSPKAGLIHVELRVFQAVSFCPGCGSLLIPGAQSLLAHDCRPPVGPTAYTYLANNVMPDAVGVYIKLNGIGSGIATDGYSIDQQHAMIEPVLIAPPVACTVSGVTFTVYNGSPNSAPDMYVNRTVMIGSTPQIPFVTHCTMQVNAQGTGSCTTPIVGSNPPYQYLSATAIAIQTMPNGHVFTRFTCQ